MHSSAIFIFFATILSWEPRWLLVAVSVRLHLVEAEEGGDSGEWGEVVLIDNIILCSVRFTY